MAGFIFIIGLLLGVTLLWRVSGSSHGRALQRIFFLLFFGLVVVTVAFPETTTTVANWLGIGRGADLVLYLTAFGLMFLGAISYLKSKSIEDRMAQLVSQQAAAEAVDRWERSD